jgi:hypothetical protein
MVSPYLNGICYFQYFLKQKAIQKHKAINNEQFVGTIVELDRFGFAVVNLGMSESRIAVTKLAVA